MIQVTDIRGVRLEFEDPPERIVSLVPSLTETLIDLNCPDRIIGCTTYCHEIPEARDIPSIGGVANPEIEKIRSLNPDLVLAGREENRREDVELIEEFTQVYVCDPGSVEDVINLLGDLGKILDRSGLSQVFLNQILVNQKELTSLRNEKPHIKFGYLVWWDPPMVAGGGTYITSLLENGPFVNVFGDIERYPVIPPDELFNREMDVLFISSEPYDFSDDLLSELRIKACGIPVERIDGRMCGWYGTRTARALEYLANLYSGLTV